jgi:hypothetical protein
MVNRKDPYFNISASHSEELERAERRRVEWPDLQVDGEPDGVFYGGRRVDFSGLNGLSYREKFDQQEFSLHLYVGEASQRSTRRPIKIEAYDDVDEDRQLIGIPMETQQWQYVTPPVTNPATGAQDYSGSTFSLANDISRHSFERDPSRNCGKFTLEIRDGVFVLIVKIHLRTTETAPAGGGLDVVFDYIKRRVERFWNSGIYGFNQWIYHREGCERGTNCDCSIVRTSSREYINAGCCKIPFKVVVEQGDSSDDLTNVVNLHYLNPTQTQEALDNEAGLNFWGPSVSVVVCTTDLYYPENRINTYAHEFGHMLGFPDQYPNGVVQRGAMSASGPVSGADWPIDDDSIMGMRQGEAKLIHAGASWFNDWINDNLDEEFDLIED